MSSLSIKRFVMVSGERYCLIFDDQAKLPLYFPSLYVTTQVRNRSLSFAAMESALVGIKVLLKFTDEYSINLEKRFREKEYLKPNELDALRDFCQSSLRIKDAKVAKSPIDYNAAFVDSRVSKSTEYIRLSAIAGYLEWLASAIFAGRLNRETLAHINQMIAGVKARRPIKKNRNNLKTEKNLTAEEIATAFEVFRPGSEINPFVRHDVQVRNQLMFLLLYWLGLRRGELLNIRISDIDFQKNYIVIARRADEKSDPRTYQPLVKTQDRILPLGSTIVKKLHSYILNERRSTRFAGKHDFLFITHKAGPTQGQPISISGYNRTIELIREMTPGLHSLLGHNLRHTWNGNYSNTMDELENPPSESDQEKIRSYIMGWKEGSGTASTYNKRFIRRKAYEASLNLQDGILGVPII